MRNLLPGFALLLVATTALCVEPERDPRQLNVSIVAFDPGIPADRSLHRDLQVFPRVRHIEALFLPFVLREVLVANGGWGAIRIIPEADDAAELQIGGSILGSDGEILQLHLRVTDASGQIWLEQSFSGTQQHLFAQFAVELQTARAARDDKALRNIVEISSLRYAQQLAPAAFDGYLTNAEDGTVRISRLPANNDPMLARIERLRSVEYVFTDAVDAKYRELGTDIESVYAVWREYRRKFAYYQQQEAERIRNTRNTAPKGSFEAISGAYENYKWDRQAAQEQEKFAIGFENEMGPTIRSIETRVAELEGWIADRYDEWRRILGEMFELETGAG